MLLAQAPPLLGSTRYIRLLESNVVDRATPKREICGKELSHSSKVSDKKSKEVLELTCDQIKNANQEACRCRIKRLSSEVPELIEICIKRIASVVRTGTKQCGGSGAMQYCV